MHRVREAEVLRSLCPRDHAFDGPNCLECGNMVHLPERIRTIARRALIVVGVIPQPYELVERIRCRNRAEHYRRIRGIAPDHAVPESLGEDWDDFYELSLPACPICGERPLKLKPSHVWVRSHRVATGPETAFFSPEDELEPDEDAGADSSADW